MKKVIMLLIMTGAAVSGWTQTYTVMNDHEGLVLYTIIEKASAFDGGNLLRSRLITEIQKESASLRVISRNTGRRISVVGIETPVFIGILAAADSLNLNAEEFDSMEFFTTGVDLSQYEPGTVLRLSDEQILKTTENELFSVPGKYIHLPADRIFIDNNFFEWVTIDSLAEFSPEFTPVINAERKNKIIPIKSADSLYWEENGVNLKTVKANRDRFGLFFYIQSASRIKKGMSLFLYVHADRNINEDADYTIEVPVDMNEGYVYLWAPDQETPRIVGVYAKSAKSCEFQIYSQDLAVIEEHVGENYTIDITSSYITKTLTEEFFYTTINRNDIPQNIQK